MSQPDKYWKFALLYMFPANCKGNWTLGCSFVSPAGDNSGPDLLIVFFYFSQWKWQEFNEAGKSCFSRTYSPWFGDMVSTLRYQHGEMVLSKPQCGHFLAFLRFGEHTRVRVRWHRVPKNTLGLFKRYSNQKWRNPFAAGKPAEPMYQLTKKDSLRLASKSTWL